MDGVPDVLIESLTTAGLATSKQAYGLLVYRGGQVQDGLVIADPALILERSGDDWTVSHLAHVGTMGPGDFIRPWATAEEAIADILDFFVVHPERSLEPARLREEHRKRRPKQ